MTSASSSVALTGSFAIAVPSGEIDGIAVGGGRPEIALARLSLEPGHVVTREDLAAAIWGGEEPPTWRSALRNVMTLLRRDLEAAGVGQDISIVTAYDGYRIDFATPVDVDLIELEQKIEALETAARLSDHEAALSIGQDALTLASRPVLAGASGRWVDRLRGTMLERRAHIERISGEAALGLGDPDTAERMARRMIASDPLREDGHRMLIRALQAAGNRTAALAAYESCREVLAAGPALVPSPATEALLLELLGEERRPAVPAVGSGTLLVLQQQSAFVGRRDTLDRLSRALWEAREGDTRVVAVAGEPGLGKTRLAAQLAGRAHASGMTVVYGRCDEGVALPYGAFLDALYTAYVERDPARTLELFGAHGQVLRRLLPSLQLDVAPWEPSGLHDLDQLRVERAIVHALRAAAVPGGMLLILDDMQWATRSDASVLEAIVGDSSVFPLFTLILHRSPQDPAGLRALGAQEHLQFIDLEPLSEADIAELVSAAGDGHDPADVWRRSGGNPLLASELLRHEGAPGAGLDDLIRDQLAGLPQDAEVVLRAAAVAGLEFDPHVAAAASGIEPQSALESLRAAERVGLLVPAIQNAGWRSFRHGLVRSSLLARLEPDEERRLHETVGSVLEDDPNQQPGSLAYHYGAAAPLGDWRRAVRYGLPAVRTAADAGVYEDVVAIGTRTLAALEAAGDPDVAARLDLEISLGGALRSLGEEQGFELLRTAFAGARAAGDHERMADAVLAFTPGGAASEEAFVDDSVVALYEEALEALGDEEPRRRARLLGHIATAYSWRQSGSRAQQRATAAVALAREAGDSATLSRVLTSARRILTGTGQLEDQERLEAEMLDLAQRLDDPGLRARTTMWRFETKLERGQGADLETLLEAVARESDVLRIGNYGHTLEYKRASLALVRGDLAEAERLVESAATIGRESGIVETIVEVVRLSQLMAVRREQGRLDDVREETESYFDATGVAEWSGGLAIFDIEAGNIEQAMPRLDSYFASVADSDSALASPVGFAAYLAPWVVRTGSRDRAALLYERLIPLAGQGAWYGVFGGPIDYPLGLIARLLGRHDEAERRLADAVAFCERLGAPLWQRRCEREQIGELTHL